MDQSAGNLPIGTRRFTEALLTLDRMTARSLLEKEAQARSPLEALESMVVPALEHIGLGWEQGRLALSQIYMTGKLCEELIGDFLPDGALSDQGKPRVAIAVLRDYHLLGKKIVVSMLRSSGIPMTDFGHGLTEEDLVARTRDGGIEVLLISTLMLPSAMKVKQVVSGLRMAELTTKVAVGGAPFVFDDQLWKEVGADAMGRNAADALAIVSRYLEAGDGDG